MLRGLKVGIDGVLSSVEIDDTTADARMEGMHRAIGCHTYDVVGYTDTVDVWVDDEGLYRSSVNAELSVMLRRSLDRVPGSAPGCSSASTTRAVSRGR